MEEKSIKINAPEGYEIDEVNSSFSEIKFKPIECKYPESWEDAFVGKGLNGFYITGFEGVIPYHSKQSSLSDINVFKTKKQAQAMLAYAQITQLMALPCYNGDWEPNWDGTSNNFIIERYCKKNRKNSYSNAFCPIAFKTREARDAFYDNHMDLLKTYFELD